MMGIHVEKITVNIGVGEGGEKLANAKTLVERLTEKKAIITKARTRNPTFKLRAGDPIGVKVTMRGKDAIAFLKKAFETKQHSLPFRSVDKHGNIAFGIPEYIDFPGMKYDPKIGMLGFDVCMTIEKPGARIARRKIRQKPLPARQRVKPDEARAFVEKEFNVKFVTESSKE